MAKKAKRKEKHLLSTFPHTCSNVKYLLSYLVLYLLSAICSAFLWGENNHHMPLECIWKELQADKDLCTDQVSSLCLLAFINMQRNLWWESCRLIWIHLKRTLKVIANRDVFQRFIFSVLDVYKCSVFNHEAAWNVLLLFITPKSKNGLRVEFLQCRRNPNL